MLVLLLRALLDPVAASYLAAALLGDPELGPELHATCMREAPRCQLRGVHERDAGASSTVWRNAMRRGALDPFCWWHLPLPGRNFSTSGPWGAMRGYTWHHLAAQTGISCAPLELLDVPLFGALAAGLRMRALCRRHGACDRVSRRRYWAGLGTQPVRPESRPYTGVRSVSAHR